MNFIIFDLESTCVEIRDKNFESEIIEIGAVKATVKDDKLTIIDEFQTFLKPRINPILTDFCKNLTSIKQIDVDNAPYFYEIVPKFFNWVSDDATQYYWLCSWGKYDKNMLMLECDRLEKPTSWLEFHYNIKTDFARIHNIKKRSVSAGLDFLGIEFEGTLHRGIDDSRNIFKLFLNIFDKVIIGKQ